MEHTRDDSTDQSLSATALTGRGSRIAKHTRAHTLGTGCTREKGMPGSTQAQAASMLGLAVSTA